MILANAAAENKEAENEVQRASLVLRIRESGGSLSRILKIVEVSAPPVASAARLGAADQNRVLGRPRFHPSWWPRCALRAASARHAATPPRRLTRSSLMNCRP